MPTQQQFPQLFETLGLSPLYDTLTDMLVHQRKLLHNLQQTGSSDNTVTGQSSYVGRMLQRYAPLFERCCPLSANNTLLLLICWYLLLISSVDRYAPAMRFMADYTMYYETASTLLAAALEENEELNAFVAQIRQGACFLLCFTV